MKWVDKYANMDIGAMNAEHEEKFAAAKKEGDDILALANQFLPSGLQVTPDLVGSIVNDMRTAEAYTFRAGEERLVLEKDGVQVFEDDKKGPDHSEIWP